MDLPSFEELRKTIAQLPTIGAATVAAATNSHTTSSTDDVFKQKNQFQQYFSNQHQQHDDNNRDEAFNYLPPLPPHPHELMMMHAAAAAATNTTSGNASSNSNMYSPVIPVPTLQQLLNPSKLAPVIVQSPTTTANMANTNTSKGMEPLKTSTNSTMSSKVHQPIQLPMHDSLLMMLQNEKQMNMMDTTTTMLPTNKPSATTASTSTSCSQYQQHEDNQHNLLGVKEQRHQYLLQRLHALSGTPSSNKQQQALHRQKLLQVMKRLKAIVQAYNHVYNNVLSATDRQELEQ